jgi:Cu/Ag efflux protein CusF
MKSVIEYFTKAYSGGLLKEGYFAVHKATNELYVALSTKKTVKLIHEDSSELQGGAITMVWAEEATTGLDATLNGGFQFSFGNGATSTNGITIPNDCTIVGMSITSATSATGTVELYINGAASGLTVSLSASTKYFINGQSIAITAGDNITFRTTVGAVSGSQIVIGLALATLGIRGADGVDGADGASSYTDAEIKTMYENNANTNVFTDYEKSKLATIETGADDITALTLEVAERDYTTRTALAYHIHKGHI